jgi:hypothetical protein
MSWPFDAARQTKNQSPPFTSPSASTVTVLVFIELDFRRHQGEHGLVVEASQYVVRRISPPNVPKRESSFTVPLKVAIPMPNRLKGSGAYHDGAGYSPIATLDKDQAGSFIIAARALPSVI